MHPAFIHKTFLTTLLLHRLLAAGAFVTISTAGVNPKQWIRWAKTEQACCQWNKAQPTPPSNNAIRCQYHQHHSHNNS